MTPLWRKIASRLRADWSRGDMPREVEIFLNDCRCFDMSAVGELCEETRVSILMADPSDTTFLRDLGERCVVPCEFMWLEIGDAVFFVCALNAEGTDYLAYVPRKDERGRVGFIPIAGIEKAGDLFQLQFPKNLPDDAEEEQLSRYVGSMFMAFVSVINSPRAKLETFPGSKLLAKKLRLKGYRGVSTSRVYIDIPGARGEAAALAMSSSPKAYHFVRAHTRVLPGGEVTPVRAHWRGDPAFGIRIGTYVARDKRPKMCQRPRTSATLH